MGVLPLSDVSRTARSPFFGLRALRIGLLIMIAAPISACSSVRDSEAGASATINQALIKAFSQRRMIEPRLSGGFRAGRYDPERTASAEETEKLRLAREMLLRGMEREHPPELDHAFARFQLSTGKGEDGETVAALRRALEQRPESSAAHNDMGVWQMEMGRPDDALDYFAEALELEPSMPEALFNRGLCFGQVLLPDKSRNDFERLLDIETDPGWREEVSQRLTAVCTLQVTSSTQEPVRAFESAVEKGDRDAAARIVRDNFEAMRRLVFLDLCRRYLSATVARNEPEASRSLNTLRLLGGLFEEIKNDSQVTEAVNHLEALSISQKAQEVELVVDYIEAVRAFESNRPLDAYRRLPHLVASFNSLGSFVFAELSASLLAQWEYLRVDLATSTQMLRAALSRTESRQWPYHRAKLLTQLAGGYSLLGQDSVAIKLCEEARKLAQGVPELEAKILQFIAVPYWHLGDLDSATARLRDSTGIYLRRGEVSEKLPNLAYNYYQFADIYALRNRNSLALLYAKEALSLSLEANNHSDAAEYSSFVGALHARLNDSRSARDAEDDALAFLKRVPPGSSRDEAETFIRANIGEVNLRAGNHSSALVHYRRSESLAARDKSNLVARIRGLRGLATAQAALGRKEDARATLVQAVRHIERYRGVINSPQHRTQFLDALQGVFDALISLDSSPNGRPQEAFEMSELSRARALLDQMLITNRGELPIGAVNPLGLKAVRAQIPEDLALVEYSVTDGGTYIFLVKGDEFLTFRLPVDTKGLDRLVFDYLSDLTTKSPDAQLKAKAQELYRLLIEPIAKYLDPDHITCIIPDKVLHLLPFAALVDENGNYLIERHQLIHSPSASVLVQCIREDAAKAGGRDERILTVGNPKLPSSAPKDLGSLPDAEREATESARYYSSASLVLTGESATEDAVRSRMHEFDVVHLASHCLVQESSPWLAALVLAENGAPADTPRNEKALPQSSPSDSPHDGLFYLNEIYGARLPRTKLVVISACQSGLGRYYRGEGMVSLVRPFISAGVPTLLASLWRVDSAATAQLMTDFHKYRKAAIPSASHALQQAQISMIRNEELKHPYYWASFIVVGTSK